MRWVKDQKVEANLRAMGVSFETAQVPVEQIDLDEGIRRQARLIDKLDQDHVLGLAVKMAEPEAAFPMCILQKPPRGRFWPWSGNHRLAAFGLSFPDERSIDAYVVAVKDPVTLDVLPRVVNVWESAIGFGKPERVANARWCIEHHSIPIGDACRLFAVKEAWVYVANAANKAKEMVADVPGAEKFSRTVLTLLHPLTANAKIAKATAKLLVEYNVRGDDARSIIDDVRRSAVGGELQQQSELARWERTLQSRRTPPRQSTSAENGKPERKEPESKVGRAKSQVSPKALFSATTREAFLRHLTGLAKVLERADSLTKLQMTDPADLITAERAWKAVRGRMDGLYPKEKEVGT